MTRGLVGERCIRLAANALHHRHKTVGALRRQMLLEMQLLKKTRRIDCENLRRCLAGIDGEEDGDQAANDVGIAIANEKKARRTFAVT